MAAVRIEEEAFSDVRYDVLATLCLLADADHARGKMAVLWRQCTTQGTYVLSESVVRAVLGANGACALLESGLGEQSDAGFRIKGTRGRIEWLQKLRKNAQKGGKAKAAKRQTRGSENAATTLPPPFPPALALALAPVKKEREPAPAERAPKLLLAEGWSPARTEANLDAERIAVARGIDLRSEILKLRDWAKSGAHKGADWDARWRNWIRNAKAVQSNGFAAPGQQPLRASKPL